MKKIQLYIPTMLILSVIGLAGCQQNENQADAYGNFEAVERIISAEANGKLMTLSLEEGQKLTAGQVIGYVDTTQLYLKKQQVRAAIRAVLSKRQNVDTQTRVFEEQKANLQREISRVEKLLADGAATQKQLDDLKGNLELVERQMIAQITSLNTANRGIASEVDPLTAQIKQIDDQIARSIIKNPVEGTVLTRFAEEGEVTAFGRPLYKLADLDEMVLRVYIQGNQLDDLKIGQTVEVLVDADEDSYHRFDGKVSWVSESAEFTPRSIQTKEERSTLVYAAKVQVRNDGSLKIGMPAEVNFSDRSETASVN